MSLSTNVPPADDSIDTPPVTTAALPAAPTAVESSPVIADSLPTVALTSRSTALNGESEGGLYTTPEPRRRVRRRKRKGGLLRRILKRLGLRQRVNGVLIGVISAVVVAVVGYSVLVVDSLSRVNTSITNLERILSSLQQGQTGAEISMGDFQRLRLGVREVDESLVTSQQRLALIRPFQNAHPNIDITLRSLDIARELTAASRAMLNGAEPAVNYLLAGNDSEEGGAQLSSGDRLVELLEIGSGPFNRAQTTLNNAAALITELNVENAPLDLLRTTERIISFYDQVNSINGVFLNASELLNTVLGLNGNKTYLVLAVNSDELRPSGGFLSTWGWLKVRSGRIVEFDYSASLINNPIPPAAEMAPTFPIPNWWIQFRSPIYAAWDGSWYADFPSTAEMAMWYYNNGGNINAPVDGVLSIDIYAFEYVLQVLESVRLPDYPGVTVTSENFRELVYDIRAFGLGQEPHKQFVAALYAQIMQEWQNASRDPAKNTGILNALLRAVQEKHMMVYLAGGELNTAIDLLGWSGNQVQQQTEGGDYLMVVDSNMTNKSSRSIQRSYIYDVTLRDDLTLEKRLTLNYELPASIAEQDPAVDPEFHGPADYTSMVQVYAPEDSTLIEFSRDINFPNEHISNNLWLISTAFVTPFDNSRRVQFEYSTANGYSRSGNFGRYRLEIQKQPGTNADPVTVQITLPVNTRIAESSPPFNASFDIDRPVVEYALQLLTDQRIDLIFEYKSGNAPVDIP